MRYTYLLFAEVDTSDGEFIHNYYNLGDYDISVKEDRDYIKAMYILLSSYNVEDGQPSADVDFFEEKMELAKIDYKKIFHWKDNDLEENIIDRVEDFQPHLNDLPYEHDFYYRMLRIPSSTIETMGIDFETMNLETSNYDYKSFEL